MNRSYIYVAGAVFLLLATVLAIVGAIRLGTQPPPRSEGGEAGGYATFSVPANIFESLQPSSDSPLNNTRQKQEKATVAQELQQSALQNIITLWEMRPGSSGARTARAATQALILKDSKQKENEEIKTIFDELIGVKITESFSQSESPETTAEDTIWLGNYIGGQGIVGEAPSSQAQEKLRAYGNDLGASLTAFNLAQGDQTNPLDRFVQDRTNTAGLKKLADGYVQLSKDIANISEPKQVAAIHSGLVASYKSVGELLRNLSTAENDEELLERMLLYNASAEEVAKYHVALITLFKANDIAFKSYESGSIFSFSPQNSNSL
ncbi:hypothetical protein CL652_00690 [bacterium]|nr:hypothetical protein [bacterium]|tara:strand:+ start:270 stop:1235 length:966 start_codon:yes stop_codon:yes gene_type:complete